MISDEDRARFGICQVEMHFGDGEYLFRLPIDQIGELQEKCGAGIGAIWKRVLRAEYRIEDLLEVLRLGLIGGGQGLVDGKPVVMTPLLARTLVRRYGESLPKQSLFNHAVLVLTACVEGYEAPSLKKKEDGATTRETDGSISAQSTATVPSSESAPPAA